MPRDINKIGATSGQPERQQHKAIEADGFKDALRQRDQTARRGAPRPVAASARAPRLDINLTHAQRLAHWAPFIADSARRHGVPVELACGIMIQESGGNPRARSHCGATGLMQLMPATARRMGVTQIWDPRQNIEGGVKYLGYLLRMFRGNAGLAAAAYNAGEGAVQKYGGVPPYSETQHYVPRVLSLTQSIGHVIRGGGPIIGMLIRHTLPRHAIANFSLPITRTPPPARRSAEATAIALGRL